MKKRKLGIIGGSGLYKMDGFEKAKWKKIKTAWGNPSDEILIAKLEKEEICFIPRHARGHKINPSNINFRANIDAMKQMGVTDIVSVSAVGSLKENLSPGTFVIVDQFIDRTFARVKTFFDEEIVAHVSMAKPVCESLGKCCETALKKLNISHQMHGTYIVMEGPQFSTFAESKLYRSWGADVIGMTNMPEAKLAREAEMCYTSLSMVTDFDCWHPDHDSVEVSNIIQTLTDNSSKAQNIIENLPTYLTKNRNNCNSGCNNALDNAIITSPEKRDKKLIKELDLLLKRFN